ncbi:TIGR02680 family protein [Cohnella pontilimi]|uniref:TIGR02680 family protein n=1 Tax=Cohnella pontilimi TaxID=2564100 RepID=A0A4U0FBX9_9BACL|nr:TIGR02680 family protein [Cohnella pontilimi]TJY42230.1 TIGR02680 family protein [Cohnella pontilimi]
MAVEMNVQEGLDARWRMMRFGLLNFWYYDEEVFELEEGRIILRGANGSGKSVTMQSFLPLVLDGDKRSHRLDPFGSRDRRIEYYLLGEADSGKSDVTGYLWMEFANPSKGLTKTIGIGLRARRGGQVQFWGFLLDDGRRIGENFWLYDRNHWFEHHTRIPLSRQDLEKTINSGGQVVQDQASYRDMVNKQLFGFADAEAFQDLLHLMIQLRSPKLSKDFKPSAIYDILHDSLPPLQEEDLRPLSEVLEDMDQIADRLDELRLHRKEMEKLQDAYDRYNKRTLYDQSVQLLERNAEYSAHRSRMAVLEAKRSEAEEAKQAAIADISRTEAAFRQMSAEIDVLENHEVVGKQRELEAAASSLSETEKHLERTQERLGKQRMKQSAVARDLDELEQKRSRYASEQRQTLQELESLAQDLEFAEHPVYHRYWDRGQPEDDRWREPWKRDLRQHRERLETALGKAREEREAARIAQELETELGEARKQRDERERGRAEADKSLESGKEAYREAVLLWRGTLQEVPFDDVRVHETFQAVTAFGPESRSPEPIRAPMLNALAVRRDWLAGERLQLRHEKKELERRQDQLREDKRTWEDSREPEPPRSEARAQRRRAQPVGSGSPLFAVCDFQVGVDEVQKARIEEALERSGLLDAWISPDGRLGPLEDGQEELWITAQPHEIGYTLADVLVPSPSEGSGLRAETIHAVLRTFLWVEEGDIGGYESFGAVLSGSGMFQLGPLAGATAAKSRAEYIGKETRKRTRMLEVARLQSELELLGKQLEELDSRIAAIQEREQVLQAEGDAFPAFSALEQGLHALLEASYRLDAALTQENRALERFKDKTTLWRDLQRQVNELTAGWTRLKRLRDLEEAVSITRDYDSLIGGLHSAWSRSVETANRIGVLTDEKETLTASIEDDEMLTVELDERRLSLRAQVDTLRKLMEELGLADISRRIETLKADRERLGNERKAFDDKLDKAKDAAARADESVRLYQKQETGLAEALQISVASWHREMRRNLIAEWRERYSSDEGQSEQTETTRIASDIKHKYDAAFLGKNADTVNNTLLGLYNEVRSLLTDYVLEIDIEEETGRIVIRSMRDRAHPLSPQLLVEELTRDEQEQSVLLNEKDRELYEEIILRSVGKAIRQRIHRAESWVKRMNRLMEERNTSSGLRLKLDWDPKAAQNEQQMDTAALVELLKRDSHRLREDEIDAMIQHFRYQIGYAKQTAQSEKESLRKHLYEVLDYRNWFEFELKYRKGEQTAYRPLSDSRFNVLSGGEKAMAMYIPLFAATWSRYSDARADAPRLISLDEAFAGVDEENMRDMFQLLTEMGFDYMMTSQVLWGCYDTVPQLAIYEIYRPKDVDFVTLFRYRWNGRVKEYVQDKGDAT